MTGSGEYLMKCKFKVLRATVGAEFLEFLTYSKYAQLTLLKVQDQMAT